MSSPVSPGIDKAMDRQGPVFRPPRATAPVAFDRPEPRAQRLARAADLPRESLGSTLPERARRDIMERRLARQGVPRGCPSAEHPGPASLPCEDRSLLTHRRKLLRVHRIGATRPSPGIDSGDWSADGTGGSMERDGQGCPPTTGSAGARPNGRRGGDGSRRFGLLPAGSGQGVGSRVGGRPRPSRRDPRVVS